MISRFLRAPRAAIWRAWAEPKFLKQWFALWTTPEAEIDLQAGGSSLIVTRSPEGQDFPTRGVYLEVIW